MNAGTPLRFTAIVLVVVHAGIVLAIAPGAFFSGDEGVRWLQVDSIARRWWTSLVIEPPGGAIDPEGEFAPAFLVRTEGGLRSIFPATLPLAASVPYALLGRRALYLLPLICLILCLPAAVRLATPAMPGDPVRARRWAMIAGIAAVVTTPLVFYGATFWEHAPATAMVLAAMILLSGAAAGGGGDQGIVPAFVSGLLLGLAAACRPEAVLMIPCAVAAGLIAWGKSAFALPAGAVAAGAATLLVPRAAYHKAVFGSLMPPQLAANLPGGDLGRVAAAPLASAASMLAPVAWTVPFFLAAVAAGFAVASPRAQALLRRLVPPGVAAVAGLAVTAVVLSTGPLATVALEFEGAALSTHQRGFQSLAHTMPLLALCPMIALIRGGRAPAHLRFLGWSGGMFVTAVSLTSPVTGGLQWGPRLLLPAVPLIASARGAAIASRAASPGGRLAVIALGIVLTVGVATQGVGLRFLVAVRSFNAEMIGRVARNVSQDGVIVSDFFPVPQLLAVLAPATPVLYLHPGADTEALDARLDASGRTAYRVVRRTGRGGTAEPPGGEAVDLGGGLFLTRHAAETGIRGFSRMPRGD